MAARPLIGQVPAAFANGPRCRLAGRVAVIPVAATGPRLQD
jgi:hypothetical protein